MRLILPFVFEESGKEKPASEILEEMGLPIKDTGDEQYVNIDLLETLFAICERYDRWLEMRYEDSVWVSVETQGTGFALRIRDSY